MTDMLIRDVPDEVIAAPDAHARPRGLSRNKYVRRRLARDAATSGGSVTVEDLRTSNSQPTSPASPSNA